VSLDQDPKKRTGKRSRLHLDLYTVDQDGEVERLVELGATRYPWRYEAGDDFVVLEDPDRNLFCVVEVPSGGGVVDFGPGRSSSTRTAR